MTPVTGLLERRERAVREGRLKESMAFDDMLLALKTTAGNIRSLGPAGALDGVPEPYREWLRVVDDAVAAADAVQGCPAAPVFAAAPELLKLAHAASHALRSYQHGNAAPDLARDCANALDDVIAKAEGRTE